MRKALAASTVLALAFVAAAVLPGCGGSSSPPPTKSAYLNQVRAICKHGQVRHDKIVALAFQKFESQGQTSKGREEVVRELQGPYEETTDQLAELTPPKGGETKVKALVKAREKAAAMMSKDPLIVFTGHPYQQPEKFAKAVGAIACIV